MKYLLSSLAFLMVYTYSQEPVLQDLTFVESSETFVNPERGFHRFQTLTSGNFSSLRGSGNTLIYGRIDASGYRNGPFPDSFLEQIRQGFANVRSAGIKVNPRVVYTESIGNPDAPIDVVLNHIEQLGPIWQENVDVINVLDPGFIGAWGEWHSSTNNLNSEENMNAIIEALLENLPEERMMLVRQPHFKRRYVSGDSWDENAVLSEAEAFSGTPIARIGHLNDCFLSSDNDVGTYTNWNLQEELAYLEQESRYVTWGGETCSTHERNDCDNTLTEMAIIHVNYLNRDYNGSVISKWESQGCYDEIERRLGYRFVLTGARIADAVKPGGTMQLSFTINNVGFGELFNPRYAEVVLSNGSAEHVAVLDTDPRFWSAGQESTVNVSLSIPTTMAEGTYSVGLRMPDLSASIHDDPRYAIRFANQGVWDDATGINTLKSDFSISSSAPGAVDPSFTDFAQIGGTVPVGRNQPSRSPVHTAVSGNELIHGYSLDKPSLVSVAVLSVNGKRLSQLWSGRREAGDHSHAFSLQGLTPGLHVLETKIGGKAILSKFVVVDGK
ncbi:DUF4832 domain-containing protein [Fibrobacterota bacterium]